MRSLNVALRQELDLYTCYRPVRYFNGVPSPVKKPELVDMHIFRENTEDIYAGIEYMHGKPETEKLKNFLIYDMGIKKIRFPATSSIGIKPVSVEGTERLVRQAIKFALEKKLPSVTLVHKGNIMKFTEGSFMKWGYALAEREFGDRVFTWEQHKKLTSLQGEKAADEAQTVAASQGKLIIKDVIADAFLQQILTRPADYSVIATLTLLCRNGAACPTWELQNLFIGIRDGPARAWEAGMRLGDDAATAWWERFRHLGTMLGVSVAGGTGTPFS